MNERSTRKRRSPEDAEDTNEEVRAGAEASASEEAADDAHLKTFVYEGEVNALGRPHGRGRLLLDDDTRVWHEGRFRDGVREGRGTTHFPPDPEEEEEEEDDEHQHDARRESDGESISSDDDDDTSGGGGGGGEMGASRHAERTSIGWPLGGDYVTGMFKDDVIEGWATYHSATDGGRREGRWASGELTGLVREYDGDGTLTFVGEYALGMRHGPGWFMLPDGGTLRGTWTEGSLSGRAMYTYPRAYGVPADDGGDVKCRRPGLAEKTFEAFLHALRGVHAPALYGYWKDGEATRVKYFRGASDATVLTVEEQRAMRQWFETSEAAFHEEAYKELAREPYEASRLRTRRGITGSFEVTPKVEVKAGEVLGFVSGPTRTLRPSSEEMRGAPRWRPSSRVFFLSDDPAAPEPPEDSSGADPDNGTGAGGVFIVPHRGGVVDDAGAWLNTIGGSEDSRREEWEATVEEEMRTTEAMSNRRMRTVGQLAPCVVRDAWSCRREPFTHPILGDCFALVAEHDIPAPSVATVASAITHPPDYTAGWRLNPRSEAGYYYHLANTPPHLVFESDSSSAGVGRVRVRSHGPWRAMYLDNVEQGLGYDPRSRGGAGDFCHDPMAIGFEYVRAMATAATAAMGADMLISTRAGVKATEDVQTTRVLCVGLGAGTLPAFFHGAFHERKDHHSRHVKVTAVEVEPDVVEAAESALGLTFRRAAQVPEQTTCADENDGFTVVVDDASRYLSGIRGEHPDAEPRIRFDCILLDAYDGQGCVPAHLQEAPFLDSCAAVLSKQGCVVANLWNGPPDSEPGIALARFSKSLRNSLAKVSNCARVRLVTVDGQENNVVVLATVGPKPRWMTQETETVELVEAEETRELRRQLEQVAPLGSELAAALLDGKHLRLSIAPG